MSGPVASHIIEAEDSAMPAHPRRSAAVPSLRSLAIRGSSWTLAEYVVSQILRLGTNIILTRLLVPDAFGVMLVVNAVIQGLQMFSDLGLGQNIIQDKRGEDARFLNTAWTVQVLRGFVLFLGALALAGVSTHVYTDMPELLYLIPVCAIGTLISGFNSVNLYLLNRRLQLLRLSLINVGAQCITVACMVAWAMVWPSVWALVSAHLVASITRLIASHTLCPGPRAKFEWDPEAARSMFRFGRWIFLSTVFGFIAIRGDAFIFGLVESAAFMGVYAIALFLNQGMVQALHQIAGRVLFPIYARLAESGPERLRQQMFRMRAVLMALSVPAVCAIVVFGSDIVSLIYDDRYDEAGWMLELLSAGAVASVIGSTIGPVLLAVGDSFRFMALMAIRTVILIASMAFFWWQFGTVGLVFGVAIPDAIIYPFLVLLVRKYGVWHQWLDLAGVLTAYVLIQAGWMLWN